jgi:CheY-like chemotaxis protein
MSTIKRILLVEDDPRDVTLTLSALEEYHLANQVQIVSDGEQAVDYLWRRGKYSGRDAATPVVVLLDLKLPKLSGLEVLKQVKEDRELRTVPIVVLTSSREDRDLEECYRLGVNAYVVKPVVFHEFVEAVKELGVFWAAINEPPPVTRRASAVRGNHA